MIIAWHFLFYSFYKFFLEVHYFFNKINPLVYLFKMKIFEDHLKRRDISVVEDTNKVFENRSYGFTIQISLFVINILLIMMVFAFINIILIAFEINFYTSIFNAMAIVLPSILINTFWILSVSRYTSSFLKFDQYPKSKKRRNYTISLIAVCIIIGLFFLSYEYGNKFLLPPP